MTEKLNNQFVPYELSLQLKELGFDEPCLYAYDKNEMLYCGSNQNGTLFCILNSNLSTQYATPLWQQSFDWFRIKYNLFGFTKPFGEKLYDYRIYSNDEGEHLWGSFEYDTFEASQTACLQKLIEICKKKNLNL